MCTNMHDRWRPRKTSRKYSEALFGRDFRKPDAQTNCSQLHSCTAVNRKSAANVEAESQPATQLECSPSVWLFFGFFFPQDTIVALQALSMFAALGGSQGSDVTVGVTGGGLDTVASFHVDQENHLLHQSQQVRRHWSQTEGTVWWVRDLLLIKERAERSGSGEERNSRPDTQPHPVTETFQSFPVMRGS